jgi:predicted nucleotidyltransferase
LCCEHTYNGSLKGAAKYDNAETPATKKKIAEFCQRWKITEFALFGSVLRNDFRPDSDVDVLVSFAPDAEWNLFDLVKMQEELETLFQRQVDLVEKAGLRNPFRRHEILQTCQVIYATQRA